MLRTAFAGGIAALLLAGGAPARADDAKAKDVKALIAKAVEANGGAANLEKAKAVSTKFKGKFHGAGLNANMTGSTRTQSPDKSRTEASLDNDGQTISYLQVIDGNKGWVDINGNADELSKDALTEAHGQIYLEDVVSLRGLTAKGVKLTPLGESKVGDKQAVGVRVMREGHPDVTVYLDKDTGLVSKLEYKGKDAMTGDEYKGEVFYEDYKKADGLMVPHKVRVLHDGSPYLEREVTSFTAGEKFTDKDFAKP